MYCLALTFGPVDRLHLLSPGVYWTNKKNILGPGVLAHAAAEWARRLEECKDGGEGEGKSGEERAGEVANCRGHSANMLSSTDSFLKKNQRLLCFNQWAVP